jgi:hypothetical protein
MKNAPAYYITEIIKAEKGPEGIKRIIIKCSKVY